VASAIRHFRNEFEFHVFNNTIVKNNDHGSIEKYITHKDAVEVMKTGN